LIQDNNKRRRTEFFCRFDRGQEPFLRRCGAESKMFERFKRTTKQEPVTSTGRIISTKLFNKCVELGKNEGKKLLETFLKTLTPSKLLDYKMKERFDWPEHFQDWADEAFWDVEWHIDWPYGKNMDDTISSLILETIPIHYTKPTDKNGRKIDLDLNALVEQIAGMQKKLDKVETLIANAEFKLCGKDALKL